jgi:hypothetical protein
MELLLGVHRLSPLVRVVQKVDNLLALLLFGLSIHQVTVLSSYMQEDELSYIMIFRDV